MLAFLFICVSDASAIEYEIMPVNPGMIAPFILLLFAIALMPLVNIHWWERKYPAVAVGLGIIPVVYYFFVLKNGPRMIATGLEYLSFIALIGSLFVVSGGIHIRIRGRSTPIANVILLAVGAVISNVLGTTGASMVLIRPYIRTNKYRISGYHIVFFIFLVSNIGGMLTPIGDPPLFWVISRGFPSSG
jgi:Na+/H+ antiporter NhaD/arsenite permease-like protein